MRCDAIGRLITFACRNHKIMLRRPCWSAVAWDDGMRYASGSWHAGLDNGNVPRERTAKCGRKGRRWQLSRYCSLPVLLMIPDNAFIRVSSFLTQRLLEASSEAAPRCHSTWRNARPLKKLHFCLAKGWVVPSLPLPCQESLEKQRHGKPLPSVSKSLEQGRSYVVNKAHATCCKARTASGNAGWVKLLWFPMLTLETSGKIFLSPIDPNRSNENTPPSANRTAFTQPDPARETRTVETVEGNENNGLFKLKTKHATCH